MEKGMSTIGKAHSRTLIYRTCFEWNAALGWLTAVVVMIGILSQSWFELAQEARWVYLGVIVFCLVAALNNFREAWPILKAQARMFVTGMIFITPSELRIHNLVGKKRGNSLIKKHDHEETLLGYGFEWGPEHTNMAYQLMNMDTKRSQIVMPFPVRWYVQQHMEATRSMGGSAWIYNLGENALQTDGGQKLLISHRWRDRPLGAEIDQAFHPRVHHHVAAQHRTQGAGNRLDLGTCKVQRDGLAAPGRCGCDGRGCGCGGRRWRRRCCRRGAGRGRTRRRDAWHGRQCDRRWRLHTRHRAGGWGLGRQFLNK